METTIPPGPRPRWPIAGNLFEFRADQLGYLQRLAREYGDIATLVARPYPVILINHPDLVREVLVGQGRVFSQGPSIRWLREAVGDGLLTVEGEQHQRQRRASAPAFHRQRIATYGDEMARQAIAWRDRWSGGETIDLTKEMARLTITIVARTLFGSGVEHEAGQIGAAVAELNHYVAKRSLELLAEFWHRQPLRETRSFERAKARLERLVDRLIVARRSSSADDLLAMLVEAQADDAPDEIRDQVLTIFLAGHETTALLVSWAFFLLAENPDQETRLHREIETVLADRPVTMETVRDLPFLDQVISETLRLYPPAWAMSRQATAPFTLGGYDFPAQSVVIVSAFVTQRDARWFPDPDRFNPDRWTPEFRAALPRFAYFPFGGGGRQCIGEGFAWLEAAILIATIAGRWRLRRANQGPVGLDPLITLHPREDLLMRIEPRRRQLKVEG